MDRLMELMGMKVQVMGSLPPGTMLIVSPDQMHTLLNDRRISDQLIYQGGPRRPDPYVYRSPAYYRPSSLLSDLAAEPIRSMTLDQWIDEEELDDLANGMRRERERLEANSRRTVLFEQFKWQRQWWHEGRQKGWWEQ